MHPRLRVVLPAGLMLLAACGAGRTHGSADGIPAGAAVVFAGAPQLLADAGAALDARSASLASESTFSASCVRTERIAGSEKVIVTQGTLAVRRDPPTLLFSESGAEARRTREDARTRLVVDPLRRRATRWTYPRYDRCLLGVAALLMDLGALARGLDLVAVERDAGADTVSVRFQPTAGVDLPRVSAVVLVVAPGQNVPRAVRVEHPDGGSLTYEVARPTLGRPLPDAPGAFALTVPEGFALEER